jgi:hypothetical protein
MAIFYHNTYRAFFVLYLEDKRFALFICNFFRFHFFITTFSCLFFLIRYQYLRYTFDKEQYSNLTERYFNTRIPIYT